MNKRIKIITMGIAMIGIMGCQQKSSRVEFKETETIQTDKYEPKTEPSPKERLQYEIQELKTRIKNIEIIIEDGRATDQDIEEFEKLKDRLNGKNSECEMLCPLVFSEMEK